MIEILKINVGSVLYGTNTKDSDIDISGIFIQPKEYFFGLKSINELDSSIVDKDKFDKNTKYASDIKLYELGKFIKLAMDNNPNILEQLFVNDENILDINSYGRLILNNSNIFPHKGLVSKFLGYAKSQKRKMIIKSDNVISFYRALDYLQHLNNKDLLFDVIDNSLSFINFDKYFYYVGDIELNKNIFIKDAIDIINKRISKIGNRESVILKHGYDTKFASHLIRLLHEGIELLDTGRIEYPLKFASPIIDIKNNKFNTNEIIQMSEHLEDNMKNKEKTSYLPENANFNKIDILLQTIRENYYGCN